jgi:DNA polymerase-3 subunit epsilon
VLHGALLDAELLAEVYLAMTRGQNSLTIDLEVEESIEPGDAGLIDTARVEVLVLRALADELQAHELVMNSLDKEVRGTCIWRSLPAN